MKNIIFSFLLFLLLIIVYWFLPPSVSINSSNSSKSSNIKQTNNASQINIKHRPIIRKKASQTVRMVILLILVPFVFFHFLLTSKKFTFRKYQIDIETVFYLIVIVNLLFPINLLQIAHYTLVLFPSYWLIEKLYFFWKNKNSYFVKNEENYKLWVFTIAVMIFTIVALQVLLYVPFHNPPDEEYHFNRVKLSETQQLLFPAKAPDDFPLNSIIAYLFYPLLKEFSIPVKYKFYRGINLLLYLITIVICFHFARQQKWGVFGEIIYWVTIINVPIFVFMAGSFNYDAVFFLFSTMMIYHLFCFLQKEKLEHYWLALIAACLVSLSKKNGIPIVLFFPGISLILFCLKRYRDSFLQLFRESLIKGPVIKRQLPFIYVSSMIVLSTFLHYNYHGTQDSKKYFNLYKRDYCRGRKPISFIRYEMMVFDEMNKQLSGLLTHKHVYRRHLQPYITWFFGIFLSLSIVYLVRYKMNLFWYFLPFLILIVFYHVAHVFPQYFMERCRYNQAAKQARYYLCFITIIPTMITYGMVYLRDLLKYVLAQRLLLVGYIVMMCYFGIWFVLGRYIPFITKFYL